MQVRPKRLVALFLIVAAIVLCAALVAKRGKLADLFESAGSELEAPSDHTPQETGSYATFSSLDREKRSRQTDP